MGAWLLLAPLHTFSELRARARMGFTEVSVGDGGCPCLWGLISCQAAHKGALGGQFSDGGSGPQEGWRRGTVGPIHPTEGQHRPIGGCGHGTKSVHGREVPTVSLAPATTPRNPILSSRLGLLGSYEFSSETWLSCH